MNITFGYYQTNKNKFFLQPTTSFLQNKSKAFYYLLPDLININPELKELGELNIVNVGIDDYEFNFQTDIKEKTIESSHLYILIDKFGEFKYGTYPYKTESIRKFSSFCNKFSDYIENVYPLHGDISSQFIVIQFKYPKENINLFVSGKYSEIYKGRKVPLKQYWTFRGNQYTNPFYRVVTKDQSYIPDFIKFLKLEFGDITITPEDIISDNRELDTPPKLKWEVLNYDLIND